MTDYSDVHSTEDFKLAQFHIEILSFQMTG